MNQWVKQEFLQGKRLATMRAALVVVHGGGGIVDTIIPSCIWVKLKNGAWMPKALLEEIGGPFRGSSVTFVKDGVFLTNKNYSYRFRTFDRERLTITKSEEKANEQK